MKEGGGANWEYGLVGDEYTLFCQDHPSCNSSDSFRNTTILCVYFCKKICNTQILPAIFITAQHNKQEGTNPPFWILCDQMAPHHVLNSCYNSVYSGVTPLKLVWDIHSRLQRYEIIMRVQLCRVLYQPSKVFTLRLHEEFNGHLPASYALLSEIEKTLPFHAPASSCCAATSCCLPSPPAVPPAILFVASPQFLT